MSYQTISLPVLPTLHHQVERVNRRTDSRTLSRYASSTEESALGSQGTCSFGFSTVPLYHYCASGTVFYDCWREEEETWWIDGFDDRLSPGCVALFESDERDPPSEVFWKYVWLPTSYKRWDEHKCVSTPICAIGLMYDYRGTELQDWLKKYG